MKLLILGGTRFLGHHLVAAAHARQHDVTLFHRGTHRGRAATKCHPERESRDLGGWGMRDAPRAPHTQVPRLTLGMTEERASHVETILGDRHRDLSKLRGRQWDAVIDTSGYLPRSVRASAEALAATTEQYVYISTVSVYADLTAPGVDEDAPLAQLTADDLQRANAIDTSGAVSASTFGTLYGGLKALCEQAAEEVLPDRVLSIRAGLIVGAHDYTDRFTYWVTRVARGGEVLAPEPPQRDVQFIDARDLAEWIIAMIERRHAGIFNVTGPRLTMETLLQTCRDVSGSDARFTWASEQFLLDQQVAPWTEMPLWLPGKRGLMAVDAQKAVAAGLRFRSLADTIGEVLRWYRDEERGRNLRAGLSPEREQQLLDEWVRQTLRGPASARPATPRG